MIKKRSLIYNIENWMLSEYLMKFDQVQYRPLITDATGREYLAGITNIRCKCERQKVGCRAQKGGPQVG